MPIVMSDSGKPRTSKPKFRTINPKHICYQGDKIQALYEAINGNGKEGIKQTIVRLNTNMDNLLTSVQDLHAKYDKNLGDTTKIEHAFETYRAELMGEDRKAKEYDELKKSHKSQRRWKIGLAVTVILSLLGLLATVWLEVQDSRELKELLRDSNNIEKPK